MTAFALINDNYSLTDRLQEGSLNGNPAYLPASLVVDSVSSSMLSSSFVLKDVARNGDGGLIVEVIENVVGSFAAWMPVGVSIVTAADIDVELADPKDPANGVFPWNLSFYWRTRRRSINDTFSQMVADDPTHVVPQRLKEIDAKTRSLIAAGFVYNAKTFSLSDNAQRTFLGMYVNRANETYPIPIPTIDDSAVEDLADTLAVESFYAAMTASLRATLVSGVTIKQQTQAATTEAEVAAIIDNR